MFLFIYVLKKYLVPYVERLGCEFGTILVTSGGISYFASQICIDSTRDTFLFSKKNKADKVCTDKFRFL